MECLWSVKTNTPHAGAADNQSLPLFGWSDGVFGEICLNYFFDRDDEVCGTLSKVLLIIVHCLEKKTNFDDRTMSLLQLREGLRKDSYHVSRQHRDTGNKRTTKKKRKKRIFCEKRCPKLRKCDFWSRIGQRECKMSDPASKIGRHECKASDFATKSVQSQVTLDTLASWHPLQRTLGRMPWS